MSDNPPGWYKDPADPATQRYWDGEGWLGDPLPIDATPPDGPLPGSQPTVPSRVMPARAGARDTPGWQPPGWTVPGATQPTSGAGQSASEAAGNADPEAPNGAPPAGPDAPGVPGQGWPGAPGGMPPGPYPPGMLPPGAFPPGAYHPGAYPPGSYPPGGPPPGALPPGAYPPGAFPPGALPPGAFRPGGMPPNLPPSWVPPIAYQAGRYVFVTEPRPHGLALAPLGRRLVARLIDILAVAVASAALLFYPIHQWIMETGAYYSALWHAFQDSAAGRSISTTDTPNLTSRGQWLQLAILFMLMLIWLVYEVPFIANHGQTLGKRIMGIKVVKLESDDRIGYGRAVRRWNTLGIATLLWQCAGIGFILQFIDCISPTMNRPLRLAFHDRSAATVVVRVGSELPSTPPAGGTPTSSGALPPGGTPAAVGSPTGSDEDWSRPPGDDARDTPGGAP